MQLVREKFAHPQPDASVRRGRLLQELHTNLSRYAATIVSGRSGTGKTWLAADFAQACQRRTAWYKIDASDSALAVFWAYLISSLRPAIADNAPHAAPETADDAPQVLQQLTDSTPVGYAEALAHLLTEHTGPPLLVVLDDLHLIYDAPWLVPFLTRLLPLVPCNVHFLLVGRGVPPAPLWRLRSKQRLGLIEETALAFTPEETKEWWARLVDAQTDADTNTEALNAWRQTRGRAALLASAHAAASAV